MLWSLLVLGALLEIIYLALYPLLALITGVTPQTKTPQAQQVQLVQQALPGLFPWLPHVYWTNGLPALPEILASVSWLNLLDKHTQNLAAIVLATFLLLLAGLFVLLAASVGKRSLREQTSPITVRFLIMLLLTALFGVTMLLAPLNLNVFSRDMLSYGLYGRMVAIHHVNPYSVSPTEFPHDLLQSLLGITTPTTSGPVWLDTSFGITLLAGESIANILVGFRLLALIAHIANAVLLWSIMVRLRPQLRLSLSLLYAWNPLILLFGVAYMHQEIVLVFFVLLAIFFFQRSSPTLGWVFVMLTSLINLLWLPLLLLFFRYMLHESRILRVNQRLVWWAGMFVTSVIVVVLAYAPYWHALGIGGFVTQLHHVFLPDAATNSLDASLLNLPIAPRVSWLLAPHSWSLLALSLMTLFLLLGFLLADSLQLIMLFSCWVLVALVFLTPDYWPWYAIGPVALAICSAHRRTLLLVIMLTVGTLLSFYFLLATSWAGQALVTIGLPLILWGWVLFFSVTWQMFSERTERERKMERMQGVQVRRSSGFSRPPFSTLYSRPTRSRR